MKNILWISLLFPLPFAIIFYMNSRDGVECVIYYLLFVLILLISLYLHRRKPRSDKEYDDYMI